MILFSHDIFGAQSAGGVSRCMIELLRALVEIDSECHLWSGTHRNDLLEQATKETWSKGHIYAGLKSASTNRILNGLNNELSFRGVIRALRAKLVHRTYYPTVDFLDRRIIRVETVHDMLRERTTGIRAWSKSQVKRNALKRADHIVCVSQSTKEELISIWPWAEKRVTVIPHGVRKLATPSTTPSFSRPYFLFVGRRDFYKNFPIALEALRISGLPDHDLVCFGGNPFSPMERRQIDDTRSPFQVRQISGDDACLAGLYEHASALLYPSSYEGFGLPILEAMIHGCPVISSPRTSLPEVGGTAALYADPARPEEWAEHMSRLVESPTKSRQYKELGYRHASQFTWQKSANLHLTMYRESI